MRLAELPHYDIDKPILFILSFNMSHYKFAFDTNLCQFVGEFKINKDAIKTQPCTFANQFKYGSKVSWNS